jgi:hypothetical protein
MWLPVVMQWYSKHYCLTSVTKTFTLKDVKTIRSVIDSKSVDDTRNMTLNLSGEKLIATGKRWIFLTVTQWSVPHEVCSLPQWHPEVTHPTFSMCIERFGEDGDGNESQWLLSSVRIVTAPGSGLSLWNSLTYFVKLTTHLQLVPRSRTRWSLRPLLHTSSWLSA